ncbi:MAG: NfeD family protein, partial [Verrucomicrobiota bacterium]
PAAGVSAGLLGSILAMSLMMKYLPKVPFVNRYFLPGALAEGAGFVVDGEEEEESRVGWTGEAVTDLKPSGKAVFQGEEIDVTAEDSFLAAGEQVRIVSEDAMRVVVRKV